MISAKLIELIEIQSDRLTRDVTDDLARNERTRGFRRVPRHELEARIADREQAIRDVETAMSAPGFYDNRTQAQPLIDRHQALMWEVGDLMNKWEALQAQTEV